MQQENKKIPTVGQKIEINLPLTPDLKEKYNTETIKVKAVFEGVFSDEEMILQKNKGLLKEIYYVPEFDEHYVISFSGTNWIYDLLPYDGKEVKVSHLHKKTEDVKMNPETNDKVMPVVDSDKPRARFVGYDKKWNIDGLIKDHRVTDGEMIKCHISGLELFYSRGDGTVVNIRSHGFCKKCSKPADESSLSIYCDRSPWPVRYVGCSCVTCVPKRK